MSLGMSLPVLYEAGGDSCRCRSSVTATESGSQIRGAGLTLTSHYL